MRCWFLVVFSVLSTAALAQSEVTVSPRAGRDSVRARYVQRFPDHFFLYPVLKQRKIDFDMRREREPTRTGDGVAFRSNKPYSLGVGMYLFEAVVEVAFAIPMAAHDKEIYGESNATDLQLNVYGVRWGGELNYQKYHGLYIDDLGKKVPANTPYPQRPDIATQNFGATVNYTINSKKFSFRAAYNFAERQLIRAGSPVVFVSLNSFRTEGDSALMGKQYVNRFGNDANIERIRVNTLGIAPGYSYNLVYKSFFLNGTLAIGPSYNSVSYTHDDGVTYNTDKVNLFVATRLSIGYNGERFFGGFAFGSQARSAKFEQLTFNSSNTSFKILFGYRLREFGFLKKRIWDIPKNLFGL
jgi:hypothetical protein